MMYSSIHIWGDSIARGILYDEKKKRYAIAATRYTQLLQDTLGIAVHNHAVMGHTVRDGLNAFLAGSSAENAICAIEYGGNDCDLDWAHLAAHPGEVPLPKVPLPLYRQQLRTFVEAVRARTMQPLLVTPIPLHAQRYFHWVTKNLDATAILSSLHDVFHIYRWQERYTIVMREIARETACPLLDMRDAFLAAPNYESLICIDGIHPNEKGHRLIADTALAAAKKIFRASSSHA